MTSKINEPSLRKPVSEAYETISGAYETIVGTNETFTAEHKTPIGTNEAFVGENETIAGTKKLPVGVWSLSSGSKANCTLVSDGIDTILIDLGISVRTLNRSLNGLGMSVTDVRAVFITHEHGDHVAGLPTFFRKHDVPVHMSSPSYLSFTRGKGFEYRDRITVHDYGPFTETVGNMTVSALPVSHDSAACLAYKITGGGVSLGVCTDTGRPTDELFGFFSGLRDVITEANHDVVMLKCGTYPDDLKYRILSEYGHTSNDDCAAFVSALTGKGTRNVMLAHLSPENNTPDLALYTVRERLKADGKVLDTLLCAPRDEVLRLT